MRALLGIVVATGIGCGDPFSIDSPSGLSCSPTGSCPPNEICVKSENMCRFRCSNQNDCNGHNRCPNGGGGGGGGGFGGMSGGGCPSYACDTDGYCRPQGCGPGPGSCGVGNCPKGWSCDQANGICRQPCDSCPSGWGCAQLTTGMNPGMNPGAQVCFGCRPNVSSPVKPAGFSTPNDYGNMMGVTAVAVGALTTGGPLDIVGAASTGNTIFVYAGVGDGSFNPPTATGLATQSHSVVLGDFNGDSKLDLVVNAGNLYFFAGKGDRTFVAPQPFVMNVDRIAGGDFNGDGKLDLAWISAGQSTFGVLAGDGTGTFSPLVSITGFGANPVALAAGDLQGKQRLDVAVSLPVGVVTILKNPGNGMFASSATTVIAGLTTLGPLAIADFNNDTLNDILVANVNQSQITLLQQKPAGGFDVKPYVVGGSNLFVVGDFNGDGNQDAVTADGPRLDILLGDGSGKLVWSGTATITTTGSLSDNPTTLASGDFNGDGKLDLVVGLNTRITVLLNITP